MASGNLQKHRRSRIRARYRSQGLDGFGDHEVLEFLLCYCFPRCDTNETAYRYLNAFNSLHNLLDARVEALQSTLKCSENIAVFLNMLPAVANRYFRSKWGSAVVLDNAEIAGKYAIDLFVGEINENFYVLCLDKRCRLINTVKISEGTVDEAPVYTREVLSAISHNNATAVILAHNHPGGTMKPSKNDNMVTDAILRGVNLMNASLVDHIIVAGDSYYSYASQRVYVQGYPYVENVKSPPTKTRPVKTRKPSIKEQSN